MIISFKNRALRECCYRVEVAEQKLGSVHAHALSIMIADAEASENAQELMDLLGSDINITEDDSLLVAVGSDYLATFVAAGVKFGRDKKDRVDWASVQRLKMMELSRRS